MRFAGLPPPPTGFWALCDLIAGPHVFPKPRTAVLAKQSFSRCCNPEAPSALIFPAAQPSYRPKPSALSPPNSPIHQTLLTSGRSRSAAGYCATIASGPARGQEAGFIRAIQDAQVRIELRGWDVSPLAGSDAHVEPKCF